MFEPLPGNASRLRESPCRARPLLVMSIEPSGLYLRARIITRRAVFLYGAGTEPAFGMKALMDARKHGMDVLLVFEEAAT